MSRHEPSVKVLESRLSENPQSLVFSRLADGLRESGDVEQAVSVCMRGLDRHPDCLTGRVVLGRCYLDQEKLKEAAAEFVTAIKLDRRNQTAIKMIADICARQGLKERAGDLYASLLSMDPDNDTLVELASTYRGKGDTDVFKILGIASGAGGRAAAPAAEDEIVDADRTMKMDLSQHRLPEAETEEADLGEMMVKTQQFDPKDLGVAGRIQEDTGLASDVLTGDDVSSRMETMFEIGGEAPPAAEPEAHEYVEVGDGEEATGAATLRGEEAEDAATVRGEEVEGTATVRGEENGVVSGSDISSRIEQLFGEKEQEPPPEPSISFAPTREVALDELRPAESSALSGEDIASRLNEMFKGEQAIEPFSVDAPKEKPVTLADTKVGPLLDIETKHPAATVAGATEEIIVGPREQAPKPAAPDDVLSGDDVAQRLETIFDEGEEAGSPDGVDEAVATQSAEATDIVSLDSEQTLTAGRSLAADDTRPPSEIGEDEDVAAAAGADDAGADDARVAAAAETLVVAGAKKSPQAAAPKEPPEAFEAPLVIDDAVTAEEQEPESNMSGDDVVGRMDEMFNEEPTIGGPAASAMPAPGDAKEDPAPMHLDFIPVSDEEAGAAAATVAAPQDVDKTDIAIPESETLDLSGEPEERTILMDEDLAAETMPAEEETMVAGAEAETMPSEAEAETMPSEAEAETMPSGAEEETMPAEAEAETMASGAEAETMAVQDEAETMVWSRSDPFLDSPSRSGAKAGTGASKETESVPQGGPQQDIFLEKKKEAGEEEAQALAIPDHVLTPTLADIYYQQGQPRLALQMYRRLLDTDPDNERIAKRIREIESDLESQDAEETLVAAPAGVKRAEPPAPKAKPKADKRKKAAPVEKPLAGVRIRKKAKTRRRKTR